MTIRQNEWCGACDYEGEVGIETATAEFDTATDLDTGKTGVLIVLAYPWTCPACGYEHVTGNDEEVGAEMAEAWVRAGWVA